MIGTIETKQAQLKNGYYQIGSGPQRVLILGCCRTMAYLNYLARWNHQNGNPLTVIRIDPNDWNWDANGNVTDLNSVLDSCRSDERILSVIRGADIFIHEYFRYYGMFNTDRSKPGNIYDYGLTPKLDICLPNFHDKFILLQEFINFDAEIREEARNGITPELLAKVKEKGLRAVEDFISICGMSSFPEFGEIFARTWTSTRYFWTGNHVSKHFTLKLFEMMNERFLRLSMDGYYLNEISHEDQFEKPNTRVTRYDLEMYGLSWDSPIEDPEVK